MLCSLRRRLLYSSSRGPSVDIQRRISLQGNTFSISWAALATGRGRFALRDMVGVATIQMRSRVREHGCSTRRNREVRSDRSWRNGDRMAVCHGGVLRSVRLRRVELGAVHEGESTAEQRRRAAKTARRQRESMFGGTISRMGVGAISTAWRHAGINRRGGEWGGSLARDGGRWCSRRRGARRDRVPPSTRRR